MRINGGYFVFVRTFDYPNEGEDSSWTPASGYENGRMLAIRATASGTDGHIEGAIPLERRYLRGQSVDAVERRRRTTTARRCRPLSRGWPSLFTHPVYESIDSHSATRELA
jgi:hypothetical protein